MEQVKQNYVTIKCRLVSNPHKAKMNEDRQKVGRTCTLALEPGEEKKLDALVATVKAEATWDPKLKHKFQDHTNRTGDRDDLPTFGKRFINAFVAEDKHFLCYTKRDGKTVTLSAEEAAEVLYAGCYVAAIVRPYAVTKNNPCMTVAVDGLLFWKAGEKMSGAANPNEAFADIDSEEDMPSPFDLDMAA